MPKKEPFHQSNESSKKSSGSKEKQNTQHVRKSKHEILLSSKNVEETQSKVRQASRSNNSDEKSFVIEQGAEQITLRADMDETQVPQFKANQMRDYQEYKSQEQPVDKTEYKVGYAQEFKPVNTRKRHVSTILNFVGFLLTIMWGGIVAGYVDENIGWNEIMSQQPHLLGGFLAGVLAPIAFLWFLVFQFQRSSELARYTHAFRTQMDKIDFPSEEERSYLKQDMKALSEQAAHLAEFSQTALNNINEARTSLQSDLQALSSVSRQSEQSLNQLSSRLVERSEKVNVLTSEIEERTAAIEEKSQKGVESWDNATLQILERAADIEQAMKKGESVMARASSQAALEAAQAKETIEHSFEDLSEKTQVLETNLKQLNETASANQKELTLSTDLFAADTKRLSDMLEGQMISLQDLEALSQKSMGILQQTLEQDAKQQETLSETLQDRLIELSAITDMADEKAQKVGELINQQTEVAQKAFDVSQRDVVAGIDKSISQLSEKQADLISKLDARSETFVRSVEAAKDDVRRAEEALFERHENIHSDFKQTYTKLADSIQEAKTMMGGLDQSIQKEGGSVDSAIAQLKKDRQELEDLLQNYNQGFDVMLEKAAKNKGNMEQVIAGQEAKQAEFLQTIESKMDSMAAVTQRLDDQSAQTENAIQAVEKAGALLGKQSELVSRVSKQAEEDLNQLDEALFTKQREAKREINETLEGLTKLDRELSDKMPQTVYSAKELEESLHSISNNIDKSSVMLDQKLKSQAAKIDHLSRQSIDQMSDSVGSMAESLIQIGSMVDQVQDNIEQGAQRFTNKAAELSQVSREASVATDKAVSIFGKRTETMLEAADKTAANVEKIQEAQNKVRQEVFISAAKFVMESLHSLAVDLTRSIDVAIHERMWKAYTNGDLGIFTSYLVSIEEELPMADYKEKFERDHDFRNYVSSFIKQYEEMIENSLNVDQGALLATTFQTSDMGKLYRLLCRIANVGPLTQFSEK
ncbi:MAG: hypothetical protein AAF988_01585 [Pseudomonadota bacterium]